MSIDELELVRRAGQVDPLPDETLERAELLLRAAMAVPEEEVTRAPSATEGDRVARWRHSRRVASAVAASALVLVGIGAGWAALGGARHPDAAGIRASSTATVPIVLAGYHFSLPRGFKPVAPASCSAVATPGSPMTVLGDISAAASAAGGCVTAELAAGTGTVPSDARPVAVGAYRGYLDSQSPQSEALYVDIPAARGDHYLVVNAVGLPVDQLIAVVAGGLPSSPGTTACAKSCG